MEHLFSRIVGVSRHRLRMHSVGMEAVQYFGAHVGLFSINDVPRRYFLSHFRRHKTRDHQYEYLISLSVESSVVHTWNAKDDNDIRQLDWISVYLCPSRSIHQYQRGTVKMPRPATVQVQQFS